MARRFRRAVIFKGITMKQGLIARVVLVCMGMTMAACAKIDDKAMSLVATSPDAILLVNGKLLFGALQIRIDHTGTLSVEQPLATTQDPARAPAASSAVETRQLRASCAGRFRYTSSTAGSIDLHCTDGTSLELNVAMLTQTQGYGYGQSAAGTVSLSFGMSPQSAKAFLVVPPGKRLQELPSAPFFELL